MRIRADPDPKHWLTLLLQLHGTGTGINFNLLRKTNYLNLHL